MTAKLIVQAADTVMLTVAASVLAAGSRTSRLSLN